jgi:translation initiation factor 2B subunit (eIF-2B alpha/beta/delta family)
MTHSYSDTVLNALLSAAMAGRRFQVICTESRPMCEGITLARMLGGQGVAVKLIVDGAILSRLPNVQMVLVGADAVSLDGLTNKTGTSLLALAARKFEKDMYALCGTQKFVPVGYRLPQESPKDPQEIMSATVPNVAVSNYYFDLTPLTWLTGVVTEEGTLKPAELRRRLAAVKVHTALR